MSFRQSGDDKVSAVADVTEAQSWARYLEDAEARRNGVSLKEARQIAARRAHILPGTLERLRNGRLKSIASHIRSRLLAAVLRELEAEITRLEHERHLLLATGGDPRSPAVAEVETHLAAARQALGQ